MTCLSKLIYGNRVPTTQMKRVGDLISAISVKMVDQSSEHLQTAGLSVMEDIRNGVYEKPIKPYDIKHFLKYSANYKSTSCYKNKDQRESKESSVSALRDLLLQYYDENSALRPRSIDIAEIRALRQARGSIYLPEVPSGSSENIEGATDDAAEIPVTRERLLEKFTYIEGIIANSPNCTTETAEGVDIFKRVLLDLDNFTAIVKDESKNTLQKVDEINRIYGIACHQDHLLMVMGGMHRVAFSLVTMPNEKITPDWINAHFESNLPCVNARLNRYNNWKPAIKIEQTVDSNQTAETNIGIFHSVYIDKNPTCDNAVKFYSWVTDADAFLGAKVKDGERITTRDVLNYIVEDPLGYYAFSDDSVNRLKEMFGEFDTRL